MERKVFVKSRVLLVASVVAIVSLMIINAVFNTRLSEAEILGMREKYPVYEFWNTGEIINYRAVFVEQLVKEGSIEDFVFAEATGEVETYYKHSTTGKITQNKEETNLKWWDEYFSYTVTVIKDTEGLFEKGEQIKLLNNISNDCVLPDLEEGMRIVIPINKWDGLEEEFYNWTSVGFYYITEENYAISAYDEAISAEKIYFSGMKVNKLMQELETLMDIK